MSDIRSIRPLVAAVLLLGPAAVRAQDPAGPGAGTVICLAPATVEASPAGTDPVAAVRDGFAAFLVGPSLSTQALTARLPSQVREEAQLAGCRFVLFATVKHQHKSGSGVLGQAVGGAVQHGAWAVSGTATTTAGRIAAGAAAGAASNAAVAYAVAVRRKDEFTLGYRLEAAAGQVLLSKSEKRKARADGEDLLTPLIQHAAEAVVAAAAR